MSLNLERSKHRQCKPSQDWVLILTAEDIQQPIYLSCKHLQSFNSFCMGLRHEAAQSNARCADMTHESGRTPVLVQTCKPLLCI